MCDFLKCESSHVLSNSLLEQMRSHNICMRAIFFNVNFHLSPQIAYLTRCKFTFVACVWFSQMWVFTFALKSPSIATIVACEQFFKYLFSHVSSNRLLEQMQIHISCTCVIFSCEFSHLLSNRQSHNSCRRAKFLHYDFQIACLNICNVTLVDICYILKC